MTRRALTVAALAGMALTAACSNDTELDAQKLQAALPAAVLEDHPDLLTSVVCPESIPTEIGASTLCFADLAGRPVELTVAQIDDEGTVSVDVDRTLLDVDDLAARIAERLSADVGVATSVVCEEPAVRVLEVGDEIECDATDADDRTRTFVATILDDAAAFELRID